VSGLAIGSTTGLLGMLLPGHRLTDLVSVAAALVLSSVIVTVIPEWFWLRALTQPGRDLHRLLDRLDYDRLGSVEDVARFAAMLQASHGTLLQARHNHDCAPPMTRPNTPDGDSPSTSDPHPDSTTGTCETHKEP
jgi:hypothetical protein